MRDGPLSDLVILDLSRALAGPHAAMMMADLGARVIKVEAPGHGDETRSWGPPFVTPGDGGDPIATYFLACNRNKESIALDLKSDAGREAAVELVRRSDVLIENFRPGVLERLGLSTERLLELNPRLVVLAISGFGHDGPEGGRPGYDQIAQGEAGLMSFTGSGPDDPQRVGVPIGDLLAGMYGAYGVLAALRERERTGRGQVVRTSLLSSIVGVHAFQGTKWTVAGEIARPQGNHHPSIAPYGLFHCSDGVVQVACGNDSLWRRLCAEFDLDPDQPGMSTNRERVAVRDDVVKLLERTFAEFGSETVLERLTHAGVPCGRVRDLREVYEWEQTRSQGLILGLDHSALGHIDLPGPPLRFFEVDDAGERETTPREHHAPPQLDEHGARIRAWLEGGERP